MFERYTEHARRVIFFARFEASRFGTPHITSEQILLGLLREAPGLMRQFYLDGEALAQIRDEIEKSFPPGKSVSTSVDLPLDISSKRILTHAAEEAERLAHKNVGTEHLLLGILREEESLAAQLLIERGLRTSEVRSRIAQGLRSDSPADSELKRSLENAPAMILRYIELHDETKEGSLLGTTMSLDVPRVGEEIVLHGRSARVTRVSYYYEPASEPGKLMPQKIVVCVQFI
jgi:ATP-dependent Clp protease ATP-binding subunit ClpA